MTSIHNKDKAEKQGYQAGRSVEYYKNYEQPTMEQIEAHRQLGWFLVNAQSVYWSSSIMYVWDKA